jgi:hypothetical protein
LVFPALIRAVTTSLDDRLDAIDRFLGHRDQ